MTATKQLARRIEMIALDKHPMRLGCNAALDTLAKQETGNEPFEQLDFALSHVDAQIFCRDFTCHAPLPSRQAFEGRVATRFAST